MDIEQLNRDLIKACRDGSLHGVKEALLNGADIHYMDEYPLVVAANYNNIDIVRYLLTSTELIEQSTCHSDIGILHGAAINNSVDAFKYLYENIEKDNLDRQNVLNAIAVNNNKDLLSYMATTPHFYEMFSNDLQSCLVVAAGKGSIDVLDYLLTTAEFSEYVDIHGRNEGALRMAMQYGNLSVVDYLLTSPYLNDHASFNENYSFSDFAQEVGNEALLTILERLPTHTVETLVRDYEDFIVDKYNQNYIELPDNIACYLNNIETQHQQKF